MFKIKTIVVAIFILISPQLYAAQSVEEIIKGRKAMFSENYQNAKKISILLKSKKIEEAKPLMKKISDNYKKLLDYFPENTKEGFKTAIGMSLISMVSMEIAMNATDYFLTGGAILTWWVVPIMLAVGFVTPWPYNYWRLKKFNEACH